MCKCIRVYKYTIQYIFLPGGRIVLVYKTAASIQHHFIARVYFLPRVQLKFFRKSEKKKKEKKNVNSWILRKNKFLPVQSITFEQRRKVEGGSVANQFVQKV